MQKWNAEKLSRMFAWLCLAVLVVTTLPLYGISLYNHPYYDDYNFAMSVRRVWKETGSLGDTFAAALESARNTRQTWQGTYTGTLFSNLQPGLFSEDLYWIANFFLITAMVLGFGFFFCTVFAKLGLGKHDRTSLSCLALTVMIQFMPDVGEAFYWFNGGVGNVFIYSLMMLFAALAIHLWKAETAVKTAVLTTEHICRAVCRATHADHGKNTACPKITPTLHVVPFVKDAFGFRIAVTVENLTGDLDATDVFLNLNAVIMPRKKVEGDSPAVACQCGKKSFRPFQPTKA